MCHPVVYLAQIQCCCRCGYLSTPQAIPIRSRKWCPRPLSVADPDMLQDDAYFAYPRSSGHLQRSRQAALACRNHVTPLSMPKPHIRHQYLSKNCLSVPSYRSKRNSYSRATRSPFLQGRQIYFARDTGLNC